MRLGVTGFQPERMRQARVGRGLTLSALAQLASLSAATVSRWESGQQKPEHDALARMAQQLNVPVAFLMSPLPIYGDQPAFFRSRSTATKEAREIALTRLQWLNEVGVAIQEYIELPVVNLPLFDGGNYLTLSESDIETIALACRKEWKLGLGPISDVSLVLENAGVVLVRESLGYINMDGLSKWFATDGRPYAFLAADKANGVRFRFDAAHELGHLVLHRNTTGTDFHKRYAEIEAQANRFAGAFLLPAESFAVEVSRPSLDTFLALKKRWRVSIAAMIVRSHQLGIVDQDYATRLWKNYSARGWRRIEPMDADIPFEEARLMPRAVDMLLQSHVFDRNTLLSHLGLSQADCESLCSLPSGSLSRKASNVVELAAIRLKSSDRSGPASGSVIPFPSSCADA